MELRELIEDALLGFDVKFPNTASAQSLQVAEYLEDMIMDWLQSEDGSAARKRLTE